MTDTNQPYDHNAPGAGNASKYQQPARPAAKTQKPMSQEEIGAAYDHNAPGAAPKTPMPS